MTALTAARPAADAGQHQDDPLLAAINHYRFAEEAYAALPEDIGAAEDAEATSRLLCAPNEVLANWTAPATTDESAIAALQLALDIAVENHDERIIITLMRNALPHIKKRLQQ